MTGGAASLVLLLLICLLWAEVRFMAGRTTIGAPRFLVFFGLGSVGATLCSAVVERAAVHFLAASVAAHTVGPVVEELAKALPLATIAFLTPAGRRLTIADLTLIGLTTGLGFMFVETNLTLMSGAALPQYLIPLVPGFVGFTDRPDGSEIFYAGHAVATALVGLAVGIGLRFVRRGPGRFLPGAAALVLVMFDHALVNWKLGTRILQGAAQATSGVISFSTGPRLLEWLYGVTLHGRLELVLLVAGLLIATWREGRWCWAALGGRPDLLLPDELDHPLAILEWRIAIFRLRQGLRPALAALTYFRARRALGLLPLEQREWANDAALRPYAERVETRLLRARSQLEIGPANRADVPWRNLFADIARQLWRSYRWLLVGSLGFGLVFLYLAATRRAGVLNTRLLGAVLALVGLAYAAWRMRRYLRHRRPDSTTEDGETIATHRARGLVVGASCVSAALGVIGLALPRGTLVPVTGAAFILSALEQWLDQGGNLSSLLGLAGLAAPPGECDADPCQDLRDEADAGREKLESARARAVQARQRAGQMAQARDAARQARQQAETALSQLLNVSYVEGTEGRLAGRRLTTRDLRRQRAREQAVRDRRARGEITEQEMQDELSKWADESYIDQLAGEGAEDSRAEQARLEAQVKSAREAEAQAAADARSAEDEARAAENALAAERAAQDQREAALADCDQAETTRKAHDTSDLERELQQMKRDFEEAQRQLSDEVQGRVDAIQQFVANYDRSWAKAMSAMTDYMHLLHVISGDLAGLWQARGDMAWAMRMAGVGDETLGTLADIAMILLPELKAMQAAAKGEEALALGRQIARLEAAEVEATAAAARAAEESTAAQAAVHALEEGPFSSATAREVEDLERRLASARTQAEKEQALRDLDQAVQRMRAESQAARNASDPRIMDMARPKPEPPEEVWPLGQGKSVGEDNLKVFRPDGSEITDLDKVQKINTLFPDGTEHEMNWIVENKTASNVSRDVAQRTEWIAENITGKLDKYDEALRVGRNLPKDLGNPNEVGIGLNFHGKDLDENFAKEISDAISDWKKSHPNRMVRVNWS